MPDISNGHHLPKLRPDGKPLHPSWLPRQRRGTTPQMIGRYPDYDVLSTVDTWDEAARKVVLARLEKPGPLRFFDESQEPTLRAFCDTVLAQDAEPRIPVAEFVDAKLADGRLDGYQYADMPDDRDTWRLVLSGLDETAREIASGVESFAAADLATRESVVQRFADGELSGGSWEKLNVSRAWSGDADDVERLLQPSVGLERDRLRRPGLSPRLHAAGRCGQPRTLRGSGSQASP
ncbi:hypothetical protein LAUMK13_01897 [Mycobacterium innocens]|uniref:Uncharacterized protein n=1 Tax=Mycobacterium innocens TaxID=2341083 RepID=A0A498PYY2_9MYCO|nr:hypothetical protein LAUMK13_01897 [Mycobacterium innocens]